ncbi:MAG TPA: ATP-binding protein, partial [Candidatus Cloacimonadota bacterium]|nr:ATP-binding protein [Candidatus Cloacimonadota bacterium]
ITITGPRQSGKTTLAKMAYPDYTYFDLELMQNREILKNDPRVLLDDPRGHYILDEFQYVPEILSVVKTMVDASGLKQQFVLTGSNHFAMMHGISQSLAGRTAIFELMPFSLSEAKQPNSEPDRLMFRGLYPRLINEDMDPGLFYGAYTATYLQKDVRMVSNVQDLDTFGRFLTLCASRTGSILNKESLAGDVGVDAKTISNWLSVLQSSYIIHLLQPYHSNIGKRLIKTPKLYFLDTGLVCGLLGIRSERDLATHPLRGNIFETMIVSETLKFYRNRGVNPPLFYYRERAGFEVDIVITKGDKLLPVEIKSASVVNPFMRGKLERFAKAYSAPERWLVYAGSTTWTSGDTQNMSFWDLEQRLAGYEAI